MSRTSSMTIEGSMDTKAPTLADGKKWKEEEMGGQR